MQTMARKTTKTIETVDNEMDVVTDSISNEFEFDAELLGEEFNSPRVPRLGYGIVINGENAGLFIPEKNLSKAGWNTPPDLVEKDLTGGKEKGVFLQSARMLVLGSMRPYIRYKNNDDLGDEKLTAIGWYDDNRHIFDKKIMDAVSEHLIIFLNEKNELLHQRPIRIRFKNVALWSFREALEEFYTAAELAFAKLTKSRASGKSDQWRSLCVFNCTFKGIKEGEGSTKSYCCKVESYTVPTVENFTTLFLGTKERKEQIWQISDMNNASFSASTSLMIEPAKAISLLPE